MPDFASPDTPAHWIRPRRFRVEHVDVAVRIDLDQHMVSGTVTHTVVFFPHAARETVEFDVDGPVVSSVTCAGQPLAFSVVDQRLSIQVSNLRDERLALTVHFTTSEPRKGLTFVDADPVRKERAMAWTQGAMEDHHYWFPCFDDPNNFSTYRVAITHRAGLAALSNGEQVSSTPSDAGWITTVYEHNKPHVLYLLNVVVGDLVAVDGERALVAGRSIPVRHWLPRGREAEAGVYRATRFGIEWLSATTGVPFAWSRYGHVTVHRFLWGGMENATLTTITDRVLIDDATRVQEDVDADFLVIHELVHQWYGDLLTMKAWSDIWLNESFATWLECRGTAAWRASRGDGDEGDLRHLLLWENRDTYHDQQANRYSRPLVTNRYDDAYELFDRVAYEKGSLVLEHLAQVLGEERMRAAIGLYTSRHAGDLVETDDLRQAIEDATGEPLDWFFHQWLRRDGHPHLTVSVSHDAGRGQLSVSVVQKLGDLGDKDKAEPWRLPTAVAWSSAGVVERRTFILTRAQEHLVLPCSGAPEWVAVDPDGHLPVEWSESADEAALLARAHATALSATARARACVAAGARAPTATLVAGLHALAMDAATAELVRRQALAALGALRSAAAIDALLRCAAELPQPRLRRAAAEALAGCARAAPEDVARAAVRVAELADADSSLLTAGELLAARGALRHPGATPLLRARLSRPSWNDRLAIGCIRGLGASGEAAALDDVLPLLADRARSDALRQAACAAAGRLGAEHLLARQRVRTALERQLTDASAMVRASAAKALGTLGDPAARGALRDQREREIYGHIRRVQREALATLDRAAASTDTHAALSKRVDDLDKDTADLKRRLEAVEKRLG